MMPTVLAGCRINLKSHIIQPNSATIYYDWSYNSNVLFSSYHTNALETTVTHLQNLTAISINSIRAAMEEAKLKSASDNKILQDCLKDSEQIKTITQNK
jgi:hypothetical protein